MAKVRIIRDTRLPSRALQISEKNAGAKVFVWREKPISSIIAEWVGPFDMVELDEEHKLVFVRNVKIGVARPFNVAQVKPYLAPEVLTHGLLTESLGPL